MIMFRWNPERHGHICLTYTQYKRHEIIFFNTNLLSLVTSNISSSFTVILVSILCYDTSCLKSTWPCQYMYLHSVCQLKCNPLLKRYCPWIWVRLKFQAFISDWYHFPFFPNFVRHVAHGYMVYITLSMLHQTKWNLTARSELDDHINVLQ